MRVNGACRFWLLTSKAVLVPILFLSCCCFFSCFSGLLLVPFFSPLQQTPKAYRNEPKYSNVMEQWTLNSSRPQPALLKPDPRPLFV